MKKPSRIISAFLAVLMIAGIMAIAPFSTDAATPAWKTAYINFVNNNPINDSGWYWLKDLDNNGLPELIAHSGTGMGGGIVGTYSNGQFEKYTFGGYGTLYVINNTYYSSSGRQGRYSDRVYRFNGESKLIFDGIMTANDINFPAINDTYFQFQYWVEGTINYKTVTQAQYNSALSSSFNKSKAGVLDHNRCYKTKSQIISAINNYQTPTPGTPTVSLSNTANGVYASWAKTANSAKYNVYYKKSTDSYWSSATTSNNYFTIQNAQSGGLYYVQVQGVSSDGITGGYSKAKSMTFIGQTAITSLTYNGNNTLKYSAVNGANKYQIARMKSGDKSFTYFTTANTSFTEYATGGVAYTYQVRAMYATSNSGTAYGAWSPGKSVATLVAPTVTLSNQGNSVTAKWNSIRGAVKYIVYFKAAEAADWNNATVTGTSIPITGVVAGTRYYVQVRPIGSTVNGPYSSAKSIVYAPPTKPAVTLSNTLNGIKVKWNLISGATGYIVYYKTASDTSFSTYNVSGEKDNATINKNLKSGEKYYIQVQPVYNGANGAYSAVASIVYRPTYILIR